MNNKITGLSKHPIEDSEMIDIAAQGNVKGKN
jgi:hypothetical protein